MRAPLISLLSACTFLRLVCLVMGCFYGPYIYVVLPLGGVYAVIDCLTIYYVVKNEDEDSSDSSELALKRTWIILNLFGSVGLLAAAVLFLVDLGFWSMAYVPIHIVLFVFIVILMILLLVTAAVVWRSLKGGKSNREDVRYSGI